MKGKLLQVNHSNNCTGTTMSEKIHARFKILCALIVMATLSRIAMPPFLGHLPNFSAIDATALFCGAYIIRRSTAIAIVLFTVWMSDLFINKWLMGNWTLFYSGFYWQYASYALITLLGATLMNNTKPIRVLSACVSATLLFFLISNAGVWFQGSLYPQTLSGLLNCYTAAIPFLKNSFFSDLFFTMVLFGSMEWFIRPFTKRAPNSL